jgi:hypothetical protein
MLAFGRKNEHCALTFSAKKNNNKKTKDLLLEFPKQKPQNFFLEKIELTKHGIVGVILLHNN